MALAIEQRSSETPFHNELPRLLFTEYPEYQTATAYELLLQEIRTDRTEMIALPNILLTAGTFDYIHAEKMQKDMLRSHGQINPIIVRPRLTEDGELIYDIIDGFHRVHGKLNTPGQNAIKATVMYGLSDEDLFDQRIFAAHSVTSVQFSRIVGWMRDAFAYTPWAERGLTVSQIFSIVTAGTGQSKMLGLTKQETDEVKAWVNDKAQLAQKSVPWIHKVLRIADATDEELITQVRTSGGGRDGRGVLTMARLEAIAMPIAGEYELQHRLAELVVEKNVLAPHAKVLSELLAKSMNNPAKQQQILQHPWDALQEAERREMIPDQTSEIQTSANGKATRQDKAAQRRFEQAQATIDKLTTENAMLQTDSHPEVLATLEASQLHQALMDKDSEIARLTDKRLHDFLVNERGFRLAFVFYQTFIQMLSENERRVLISFYGNKLSESAIAESMGLSVQQIKEIRQKARNTYQVHLIEFRERFNLMEHDRFSRVVYSRSDS